MIFDLHKKEIPDNLGNKAKNLMLLSHFFDVPHGYVISADIFQSTLILNNIKDKIDKLLDSLTAANAETVSDKIISLFKGIILPEELVNSLSNMLKNNQKYAVRSSGINEDLIGFSFAGQYDSLLNVEKNSVYDAIIKCYSSMFSTRQLTYSVSCGISLQSPAMAVIVQEMVDAEYSGVAFTINPQTGNDREIVIETVKGLGDSLVSGLASPNIYIYNWFDRQMVAGKTTALCGVKIADLADIFLRVGEKFGYPCDIEFSIKNERLYLLQARAITRIEYGGVIDFWTTADFKDGGVSATVCTPYMWSLYEYIWEFSLKAFLIDSNIFKENELRKLGNMFYGRPYWNLSVVKAAMAKIPGYTERSFDNEFGITPNYEGEGKTTGITLKSLREILMMAISQNRILKSRKKNNRINKFQLNELYNKYLNELSNESDAEKTWQKLIKIDYLNSESTYFTQIFINTVHQTIFRDKLLKYVSHNDYLSLLGGLDKISHLLPFYDLWEYSGKIKSDSVSAEFWVNNNADEIENMLTDGTYGTKYVNEFIEKYGYHSDKELDVTYPCYAETPKAVIGLFKETIKMSDQNSPQIGISRQRESYNSALDRLKEKVSARKYKNLAKSISEMREMLWWREEFRDISTRFYYIIRLYTLRLAKYYYNKDILKNIDDIWYLKIADLDEFISGKIDKYGLNDIILRNRKYYNHFRNYMSNNEIGMGMGIDSHKKPMAHGQKTLSGVGCCNGSVTGIARVINSLDEISRLRQGDILITKFTDTGWTSKFAILGGIVTEFGGMLCHSAIVSREYGIPCVVCVTQATELIKDGSIITVDSSNGVIYLEEKK